MDETPVAEITWKTEGSVGVPHTLSLDSGDQAREFFAHLQELPWVTQAEIVWVGKMPNARCIPERPVRNYILD